LEETEMPNTAPGFVNRPDYRVDLLPESRRVKVVFAGVTVADSGSALRVEESGHAPVYYLPEKDVRLDLLRPTDHHTRCPYKGEASYWTIELPAGESSNRRSENAVWGYLSPYDEVAGLAGYYAFYPNRVDSITVT
jgi:adenylate cyclase